MTMKLQTPGWLDWLTGDEGRRYMDGPVHGSRLEVALWAAFSAGHAAANGQEPKTPEQPREGRPRLIGEPGQRPGTKRRQG